MHPAMSPSLSAESIAAVLALSDIAAVSIVPAPWSTGTEFSRDPASVQKTLTGTPITFFTRTVSAMTGLDSVGLRLVFNHMDRYSTNYNYVVGAYRNGVLVDSVTLHDISYPSLNTSYIDLPELSLGDVIELKAHAPGSSTDIIISDVVFFGEISVTVEPAIDFVLEVP